MNTDTLTLADIASTLRGLADALERLGAGGTLPSAPSASLTRMRDAVSPVGPPDAVHLFVRPKMAADLSFTLIRLDTGSITRVKEDMERNGGDLDSVPLLRTATFYQPTSRQAAVLSGPVWDSLFATPEGQLRLLDSPPVVPFQCSTSPLRAVACYWQYDLYAHSRGKDPLSLAGGEYAEFGTLTVYGMAYDPGAIARLAQTQPDAVLLALEGAFFAEGTRRHAMLCANTRPEVLAPLFEDSDPAFRERTMAVLGRLRAREG